MSWFNKRRREEKVYHVSIPSIARGFLLDCGLWDADVVADYSIINKILDQPPASEDVMDMEFDESLYRREDLELITPVLVSLSDLFITAMTESIKVNNKDTPDEIRVAMDSVEIKAYLTLLLSSFSLGIVSQLIDVNLLKKGWEND